MQAPSTTSQPSSEVAKTQTWSQSLLSSIGKLFVASPAVQEEDDAVGWWVGGRKGRGRCRSVGEVH
ncbi:hypothetical protein N7492_000443 [Penicillium capsulatum]|uniref:Uncharacterized protein n=1 Tax=Penicillium capsulatum TaxID=69766 RepID=A0A9W9M032_9EURO|nr:hypothetical protein N7492_000443 [Penicillium capsulatum]